MTDKPQKWPRAVLIAGPTASGKSALALSLARQLGGTIVNADSMQVYRELRILTARPTPAEEARVPHRLYGTVGARETYSVARWLADVAGVLAAVEAEGRLPIFVGGTGLYFDALTKGLADIPDIPPQVRAEVRACLAREGPEALHRRLGAEDPVMAARLRPTDRQRIARALEVVRATGRSLSYWQDTQNIPLLPLAQTLPLVLAPPRAALYDAVNARFARMVEAGACAEVAALLGLNLPANAPAMKILGVAPLATHLRGDVSLPEAIAAAQTASRHYAKRQLTWLRNRMMSWRWIETKFSERLIREILSFMPDKG